MPGFRVRVTQHDGSAVDPRRLETLQKAWLQKVPTYLRQFLEDERFEIDQLKWLGSKPDEPTE